jgi:hypothetical protein
MSTTTSTPPRRKAGSRPAAPDLDRPDQFYLGREYDLEGKTVLDEPVYYDSHDLTTHGVVVGMTGSGKTGLCVTLLEEAALKGIPCVIIDLKGDLSNLLLNFPAMRPEDLASWVDPDEARRREMTVEELVAERAQTWREGIEAWGQDLGRVQKLRDAGDWRIYTPGSEAGLPVSVIQNFTAPAGAIDTETLNDRVEATTTALLGLTKITADPVQSREHILIANLLLNAWTNGRDLDLPRLISEITNPPLRKIGAFDIDMFYPEEERLRLALTLNNLLASPSFSTWLAGEPLSLASMLHGPDGKPRQCVFYLAHLDDAQRMFFLTLLLEEVLTWTRSQPGTSSLRAIVYFDELFGYLPPHPANPPTKRPLMTLLKQARAFGVGLLLATQNPMDIDYKALSNAGTWFVGKLQTEHDKNRLLEGLQGVAAERGTLTDAGHLDAVISSLGNRVFLLHDVHVGKPRLFHTRWALSYLYGPMTRDHVAAVMAPRKEELQKAAQAALANGDAVTVPAAAAGPRTCPNCKTPAPPAAHFCMQCGGPLPETVEVSAAVAAGAPSAAGPAHVPPVLPPGLTQYFLPPAGEADGPPLYQARLLGFAEVVFNDRKHKLEYRHSYRLVAPPPDAVHPDPWPAAEEVPELSAAAQTTPEGLWAEVPESINDPKKLRKQEQGLVFFLHKNAALMIFHNRHLGLLSKPQEGREEFLARCREAAKQAAADEIAGKDEKPADAEKAPGEEKPAWVVPQAEVAKAKAKPKPEKVEQKWQQKALDVREIRLAPRKADIRVTHFGLAWAPHRPEADGGELAPAYDRGPLSPDAWRPAAT